MFKTDFVRIDKLEIEKDGTRINVVPSELIEFQIFESVVDPFMTASLVLRSSTFIDETLPITGNERVTLSFSSVGENHPSKTTTFRVVSVGDNVISSGVNVALRNITLTLVRPTFVDAVTKTYSRSWKRARISDIVAHICSKMIGEELATREATGGNIDYVMPYVTPLRAVESLRLRAASEARGDGGYLFFENFRGLHFVSVAELLRRDSKIRLIPNAVNSYYEGNVLRWERKKIFNVIDAIGEGLIGVGRVGFDATRKKIIRRSVTYSEAMNRSVTTGRAGLIHAETENADCWIPSTVRTDDEAEELSAGVVRRASLNQLAVEVYMNGNTAINAGDTVEFVYPSLAGGPTGENESLTGKYLVESINSVFDGEKLIQVMTLVKDAYTVSDDKKLVSTAKSARL